MQRLPDELIICFQAAWEDNSIQAGLLKQTKASKLNVICLLAFNFLCIS